MQFNDIKFDVVYVVPITSKLNTLFQIVNYKTLYAPKKIRKM